MPNPKGSEAAIHQVTARPDGTTPQSWGPLSCGHCGADVQAAVLAKTDDAEWLLCTRCFRGSVKNEGIASPPRLEGLTVEGFPQEVSDAYNQARGCLSNRRGKQRTH